VLLVREGWVVTTSGYTGCMWRRSWAFVVSKDADGPPPQRDWCWRRRPSRTRSGRWTSRRTRSPADGGSDAEPLNLMEGWTREALEIEVHLHFVTPCRPMENGYIESFNGKFRDEYLNQNWFLDLGI
jgi:hypothetical protein